MAPKFFFNSTLTVLILTLILGSFPAPVRAASIDRAELASAGKFPSPTTQRIVDKPDFAFKNETLQQLTVKEHVFKFYLDPALVPNLDFAKTVLPKYIADMNAILAKNTDRRLVFNPEIDIILTNTQPHSNQATPPLPVENFEIWANAVLSNYPVSYGGYAGVDSSGAGVLAGLNWTRLYDPELLASGELADYWTQISNMLHEMAHVFGAGIGEYYNLSIIKDATGISPLLDIDIFDSDDSFWSDKPDFMADPLLRNVVRTEGLEWLSTREALLAFVRYSDLTATIMSGNYRNAVPTADLSNIVVRITTDGGTPIDNAYVKIWSVVGNSSYQAQLMVDDSTDPSGQISFAWGGPNNPHNNYDFLRLIKVYKDGYTSSAKYISIFDADIVKLIDGSDSLDITIPLEKTDPLPSTSTFADVSIDHFAWPWIEKLYSAGVTGGCSTSPMLYCPDQIVTRAQMAIFLERSMKGSGFIPPSIPTSFADTTGHWAQDWIEALASDGITGGCGNGSYCPDAPVTRAQMAIFLLRAMYGADYTPAPTSGLTFADVSPTYWAVTWIEQLNNENITSGCGGGNFCPDAPVTRAQMPVFFGKAFNLP